MQTGILEQNYKLFGRGMVFFATMLASFYFFAPCTFADPHANSQAKLVDGWSVKQSSKIFGYEDLLLSPLGLKATNVKTHVTMIMTPPFTQVTVYNAGTGRYFQTDLKQFRCPVLKDFCFI